MIGRLRASPVLALLAASLVVGCSPRQSGNSPSLKTAEQSARPGEPSAEDVERWLGIPEPQLLDQAGNPFVEGAPAHPQPMPAGDLSRAVVRFERCCAGFIAPDYTIELRGDGQATFKGRDALLTGTHQFQVAPAQVQTLLKNLEAADFWSLESKFDCGVSHGGRLTLSVEIGGQKKSVFHHCGVVVGLPQRIVEIERSIVKAADGPRWLIGTDATVVQLEREGFDFKSVAGADLLSKAMMYSSDAFIEKLLARGKPLETSHGPLIADAAALGRQAAFQALVRAGAFKDDDAKQAALASAIEFSQPAMVAAVLANHADPNARFEARGNITPIELAVQSGDPPNRGAIVGLLAKAGADPNVRDRFGDTLLHYCFHPDVAAALIAAGADLEARNPAGETPLLRAYDEEMALLLIKAGADISAKTFAGASLAVIARRREWPRVLALAIQNTPNRTR